MQGSNTEIKDLIPGDEIQEDIYIYIYIINVCVYGHWFRQSPILILILILITNLKLI